MYFVRARARRKQRDKLGAPKPKHLTSDEEIGIRDFDCEHNICTPKTKATHLCPNCRRTYYTMIKKRQAQRQRKGLPPKEDVAESTEYNMSLSEIGEVMGVSREYVRQLEKNALAKLRKRGKHLKAYLEED